MLDLKNITVTFNKRTQLERAVLQHLNLSIPQGQFVTLIGGNGAGKSTLLNVLAGNIFPDKGIVHIDQEDVTPKSAERRSAFISRVFQDPRLGTFTDLTIEENLNLAYGRGSARKLTLCCPKKRQTLFKEKLRPLSMDLECRLHEKVAGLSGGQRQALSLVMATLSPSKLLLLDEHTAALDPKTGGTLMALTETLIRHHQLTTLMITHSMSQALTYGDRTLMLAQGQIVHDLTAEARASLSPQDLLAFFEAP